MIYSMAAPKPNIDKALLLASFPCAEDSETEPDITGGFGWREFLAAADREGLAPLIYYNNKSTFSNTDSEIATSATPSPSGHLRQSRDVANQKSKIKNVYFATLARNMVFLQKLEELAGALAGIDFILLKGAYLASSIYASPGLRPFSDIDILVRRTDFPAANEQLTQLGYERPDGAGHLSEIPAESAYLNSVMYHSRKAGLTLHMHWHLLNSILPKYINTTLDMSEIWKAAKQSTDTALELCPEHLLIHLCEHALRHSFDRLILLRDIAEVIVKLGPKINWDRLVRDSVKFNLNHAVYYSLVFVRSKTSVSIPGSAIAALHPEGPGLCGRLFMRLATNGRRSPELCNLAYLDNIASFRGKMGFIWRIFFPPRDVLAHAYGREQCEIGPAVYIRRLLRGLRYALRPLKLPLVRHP